MTSEMIARIDAWIANQSGYVSRQDAVRHCVDLVLPKWSAAASSQHSKCNGSWEGL
jgi:hypothetical protein